MQKAQVIELNACKAVNVFGAKASTIPVDTIQGCGFASTVSDYFALTNLMANDLLLLFPFLFLPPAAEGSGTGEKETARHGEQSHRLPASAATLREGDHGSEKGLCYSRCQNQGVLRSGALLHTSPLGAGMVVLNHMHGGCGVILDMHTRTLHAAHMAGLGYMCRPHAITLDIIGMHA